MLEDLVADEDEGSADVEDNNKGSWQPNSSNLTAISLSHVFGITRIYLAGIACIKFIMTGIWLFCGPLNI